MNCNTQLAFGDCPVECIGNYPGTGCPGGLFGRNCSG